MNLLIKLVVLTITLYMFISLFLDDFDNKKNYISYKIYTFIFVFIVQFLIQIFSALISKKNIGVYDFIENAINNSLLAVVAYSVYNDLYINDFYHQFNNQQRVMVLVLLIIGFMTAVNIIQLSINS